MRELIAQEPDPSKRLVWVAKKHGKIVAFCEAKRVYWGNISIENVHARWKEDGCHVYLLPAYVVISQEIAA